MEESREQLKKRMNDLMNEIMPDFSLITDVEEHNRIFEEKMKTFDREVLEPQRQSGN